MNRLSTANLRVGNDQLECPYTNEIADDALFEKTSSFNTCSVFETSDCLKLGSDAGIEDVSRSPVLENKVVCQLNGVIIAQKDGRVFVDFNKGTSIGFPRSLFSDEMIRYGQSIQYEILERPGGIRFQKFSSIRDDTKNP